MSSSAMRTEMTLLATIPEMQPAPLFGPISHTQRAAGMMRPGGD